MTSLCINPRRFFRSFPQEWNARFWIFDLWGPSRQWISRKCISENTYEKNTGMSLTGLREARGAEWHMQSSLGRSPGQEDGGWAPAWMVSRGGMRPCPPQSRLWKHTGAACSLWWQTLLLCASFLTLKKSLETVLNAIHSSAGWAG